MCQRRTCLVLGVLVSLYSFAFAAAAGPGPHPQADVPADWLSKVRRSIQLEEFGAVQVGDAGEELRAGNPAHRFESRFDARGVRIASSGASTWKWGLSLTRWGRPGALTPAAAGCPSARDDRIELDRGVLTEWFVNTPEGLEHGFTVPRPPDGEAGRLVFDLALAGGLRPVFAEDGQAVDFYDGDNVGVLRYAKLLVTDAAGVVLAGRMEPISAGIRITVEDAGAIYPVTVDPLATSASWTAVGEAASDEFGYSVSTAGDVNGDGYSDVIVGAYGNASYRGKAYLFLGGPSGLSASASWTAVGEAVNDSFGGSVSVAGDVNGDGYSDVIVGANGNAGGRGKAYLYLGGPGGLSASSSWTAIGEAANDGLGIPVATAGDVNGDGYSDVIVGVPHNAGNKGKAYLYLGGPGGLNASSSWSAIGEAANDWFGHSVGTAGDVNGDGYSDVIVGGFGNASYKGKSYLYLGGPGGLSAVSSWSAVGEAASDEFGYSVSTAGDVNGDGYSDVIVEAFANASYKGKTYLYLGGPGGLSASTSWTAVGEAGGDNFGYPVATAGDVNGDGYSDVVVGAAGNAGLRGKTYLYLGGPGGLSSISSWTAVGEAGGANFGYAVMTAGDVNGDGYSDVLVGAFGNASSKGKAYLYLGGPGGPSTGASWAAAGEAVNDEFARSVATAGDVNGDGYSDVIVAAPDNANFTGKTYLYLGGSGGLSTSPSWTAVGEAASEQFGSSVATAGDVNGDGYSDVIIGAIAGANSHGKTYVYLGGPGGLSASPSWTAGGEAGGDNFGYAVATAGDINADGYSDVIVGAYNNASLRGKTYVYLGGFGGLRTSPSWTAVGEAGGDQFGASVATAGDVNGDGYSDVIVGARNYANSRGKTYVYLGGHVGLSANATWTAVGEAASDQFGYSVAAADVNGDGYSDVVVGAPNNASGTGKAYLYLGGPGGSSASASWTAVGAVNDYFGESVATAGDVNGDGDSDVIVGADTLPAGKAYLFLGGSLGLSANPSWTAVGEAAGRVFGASVATAGDVNGDGYSDVIVGDYGNAGYRGKAYQYFGGGGAGVPLRPRQLRADLSAPIQPGGLAYQQGFRLGLTLRSPVGRVWRKLQWQVAPWGGTFLTQSNPVQTDTDRYLNPDSIVKLLSLPDSPRRYLWRARVTYDLGQSPFVIHGPWVTLSGNGLHETDLLSVSQVGPCAAPDGQVSIGTATLSGSGKVVLTYVDPNQPAVVTGYNIYRASAPSGPWTVIGANVVDMDAGTPNNQYVDQSSNSGAPWFYTITAYNGNCGAEGPF